MVSAGSSSRVISRRTLLRSTVAGAGLAVSPFALMSGLQPRDQLQFLSVAAQDASQRIIFGLPWDAITLNPIVQQDGVSYLVNLWLFDALIRLDDKLQPVPELAESWEASEDGLTWTLKLRSDVTWHDGPRFRLMTWPLRSTRFSIPPRKPHYGRTTPRL